MAKVVGGVTRLTTCRSKVEDLFNWQMGIFNRVAWLVGAGGAYHAGLEVYGVEYAFGGRT